MKLTYNYGRIGHATLLDEPRTLSAFYPCEVVCDTLLLMECLVLVDHSHLHQRRSSGPLSTINNLPYKLHVHAQPKHKTPRPQATFLTDAAPRLSNHNDEFHTKFHLYFLTFEDHWLKSIQIIAIIRPRWTICIVVAQLVEFLVDCIIREGEIGVK